jgi:hypothetical protein
MPTPPKATDGEQQLKVCLARFPTPLAKLAATLRSRLKKRLPGLFELVYLYENQGSLVISYSPTERGIDGVCAIAVHPDELRLCLSKAAELAKRHPHTLLKGSGKTVRHVVLTKISEFERPEVQALLATTIQLAKLPPESERRGVLVLKVESQKERSRRRKA